MVRWNVTGCRNGLSSRQRSRVVRKPVALLLLAFAAAVTLLGAARAVADAPKKYQRTVETLTIPDVVLVNQDGEKVRLKRLIESDKPVIVDYIYGTCTTICPVLSAGFSAIQKKLGTDTQSVRLLSITIDPENDTPKIMKDYLKRYGAKPGWDFLTGSRADIDKVMRAFNSYFPNKMSHQPVNFIRSPKDGTWVRLYGFLSSRELLDEYLKVGKL